MCGESRRGLDWHWPPSHTNNRCVPMREVRRKRDTGMAALTCGLCENEGAVLMYTVIENGDTINVGQACLSGFALGQAASLTEGMTPELCEAYGAQFDAIAANDKRSPVKAAGTSTRQAKSATPAGDAGSVSTPGAGEGDECPICHQVGCEDYHTMWDEDDTAELNARLEAEGHVCTLEPLTDT